MRLDKLIENVPVVLEDFAYYLGFHRNHLDNLANRHQPMNLYRQCFFFNDFIHEKNTKYHFLKIVITWNTSSTIARIVILKT